MPTTKADKAENSALQHIENELQHFYAFCKENKLSDAEIMRIFNPIIIPKAKISNAGKYLKCLLFAAFVVLFLYGLSYIEMVSWHMTALGRIAMIKILPFYNWKPLKNEKCLVNNVKYSAKSSNFDCYFCEAVEKIPFTERADSEVLKQQYLDINVPVIFEYSTSFSVNNTSLEKAIDTILQVDYYPDTFPCKVASNVLTKNTHSVQEILNKVALYRSYFVQYQNCDFDAVKAFRRIFKRPHFFATELSPIQYSWVLASYDYNVTKFKNIFLQDRIGALLQIVGRNFVRLFPAKECLNDCNLLEFDLNAGEVLLFSNLWDLEYRPFGSGDNFAVILEVH